MANARFYRLKPDGTGIDAALVAGRRVAAKGTGDQELRLDVETGRAELVSWLVGAMPDGAVADLQIALRTADPHQALTALAPLAEHGAVSADPPPSWQDMVHDDLRWSRQDPDRFELSFGIPVPPAPVAETRAVLAERLALANRAGLLTGTAPTKLADRFVAECAEVETRPSPSEQDGIGFGGVSWCAGRVEGTLAPGGMALALPPDVASKLPGIAALFEGGAVRVRATIVEVTHERLEPLTRLPLDGASFKLTVEGLEGEPGEKLLDELLRRLADQGQGDGGGDGKAAADAVSVSYRVNFPGAQPDGSGVLLQAAGGEEAGVWLCLGDKTERPDRVAGRVASGAGVTLASPEPEGEGSW